MAKSNQAKGIKISKEHVRPKVFMKNIPKYLCINIEIRMILLLISSPLSPKKAQKSFIDEVVEESSG